MVQSELTILSGPVVGEGKTTTFAAVLESMDQVQHSNVITEGDTIEFSYDAITTNQ
ncbi:TPA: hypothetical protein ACGIK9_003378 [Acinetobacter baumannii]|uniref:hypothetical protein n=1 Tax=Acinetobacter baumannii TaxID=470 RepID=UPI00338E41C5